MSTVIPPLGAHVSIAGGVGEAPGRARAIGATAFQIFLKNANQWSARPIPADQAERFRREVTEGGFATPVAHSAYLINLAAPDISTARLSLAALQDELERAAQLGVVGVVLHPGAHRGEGEAAGIATVARQLNVIFERLPGNPAQVILEATAGAGSALGATFEQLAAIIEAVEDKSRLGVCLDTCHLHAAGYPMESAEDAAETLRLFDEIVGLKWLRVIHANDSKTRAGSRRDRHEHIGRGFLGEAPFKALLRDPRLRHIPFILETPKDHDPDDDLMNLATLRRLAQ